MCSSPPLPSTGEGALSLLPWREKARMRGTRCVKETLVQWKDHDIHPTFPEASSIDSGLRRNDGLGGDMTTDEVQER